MKDVIHRWVFPRNDADYEFQFPLETSPEPLPTAHKTLRRRRTSPGWLINQPRVADQPAHGG